MTLVDFESVFASATESGFLEHMFEAVSALNTVGLSMGATGNLTAGGKVNTIVLMYVGRVGPLSLAAAVSRSRKRGSADVRLAREDVAVG